VLLGFAVAKAILSKEQFNVALEEYRRLHQRLPMYSEHSLTTVIIVNMHHNSLQTQPKKIRTHRLRGAAQAACGSVTKLARLLRGSAPGALQEAFLPGGVLSDASRATDVVVIPVGQESAWARAQAAGLAEHLEEIARRLSDAKRPLWTPPICVAGTPLLTAERPLPADLRTTLRVRVAMAAGLNRAKALRLVADVQGSPSTRSIGSQSTRAEKAAPWLKWKRKGALEWMSAALSDYVKLADQLVARSG